MKTQCQSLDIISTLPQNIIETILTLMPIQDALRTSVLSKKWQYCWRSMPKLKFINNMVKLPPNTNCTQLKKYKLATAIFHVLLLHNGPEILEFNCSVVKLHMESEVAQMISYLARGNKLKELTFVNDDVSFCKLPVSFFSLQGLMSVCLDNCTFEPPVTFNGFSQLKTLVFRNVEVSSQMLQRFLPMCPLLDDISLIGRQKAVDFVAEGNKFKFVDLLQCVPLLKCLEISNYNMKYFCAGGMHHKLPTSLDSLECLYLDVCLMEKTEISSALCIIRSSPVLAYIDFTMCHNKNLPVQQTATNFLDPQNHPDLKLVYLNTFEISAFRNLPVEMQFVKLIMAKSPVLKKARIVLHPNVSVDEELKMLRDLVLLPFPRASPSAKLTIVRPKTY